MPKIKYADYKPQRETRGIIEIANSILSEYAADGFDLTLRQLYYQLIGRDLFPESYVDDNGTKNNKQSYNKLGAIISKARDAGMIDWSSIVDRGREIDERPHWSDVTDFITSVAPQFAMDLWEDQPTRVEVWVEKDALSDIVRRACLPWDVPYLACKGYVSASAIWDAGCNRIKKAWNERDQSTVIIHLGDHDPSGVDMTRDISERLQKYASASASHERHDCFPEVRRIALTMEQVERYNPPPNFAKESDSRYTAYRANHGEDSWELDALEPRVIVDLIDSEIADIVDTSLFDERVVTQRGYLRNMRKLADNWPAVSSFLVEL